MSRLNHDFIDFAIGDFAGKLKKSGIPDERIRDLTSQYAQGLKDENIASVNAFSAYLNRFREEHGIKLAEEQRRETLGRMGSKSDKRRPRDGD